MRLNSLFDNTFTYLIPLLIVLSACNTSGEKVPLEEVDFEPEVIRFDLSMLAAADALQESASPDSQQIYNTHILPHKTFIQDYLYNGVPLPDSIIKLDFMAFLSDSITAVLFREISEEFPENEFIRERFVKPAKRFAYYFPEKKFPQIVTYASGYSQAGILDMDQVMFSGRYLGLGLHYFMGKDYPFYPPNIPQYIRRRCDKEHLTTIAFHKLSESMVPAPKLSTNPTLIDRMIAQGIRLEFIHEMLPEIPDSVLLLYNSRQMEWAEFYEARTYKDLQSLLYSVDGRVFDTYLEETPFTKTLSRESAPRMGQYLGWKIVQAYRERFDDVSIADLVEMTDYRKIFKDARYRPARAEEGA